MKSVMRSLVAGVLVGVALLFLPGCRGGAPAEPPAPAGGAGPAAAKPPAWPGDRARLLFLCENVVKQAVANDLDGKPISELYYEVKPKGLTVFDQNHAMRLEGGGYVAPGVDEPFAAAFRARGEFTLELCLTPHNLTQDGPAEIVSFASTPEDHNFCLAQSKDRLVLRLATSVPAGGKSAWIDLGRLAAGRAQHVVVTYRPGELICYRDGARALASDKVRGDLSGWQARALTFGNNAGMKRPWQGRLEGLALYARALTADEAQKDWAAYSARLQRRRPAPRLEIQARLAKVSEYPDPRTQTYSISTILYEYEVEKVLAGVCEAGTVRVLHYVWADFEFLMPAGFKVGQSYRLSLESSAAHPEIEDVRSCETLSEDLEAPVYLDVGPLVLLPRKS
jgi:hypothetical protein